MMKDSFRTYLLFVGVLFIFFCQVDGITPPPTPTVISQFMDPKIMISTGTGGDTGIMWYDQNYPGWKFQIDQAVFPSPTNVWANITVLSTESQLSFDLDGICRPANISFLGFFGWLNSATYAGVVTLSDGRVTDEWTLSSKDGLIILNLLQSNNSIPARFIFPTQISAISPTATVLNITFIFSDELVPGPLEDPESLFGISEACIEKHVCPEAPAMDMDFYLFHEPNNFTLINTNVADIPGDTFFVCVALVSGDFSYFQWLSWWSLSVNTTWGQYSFCNFGSCLGGSHQLVGREGAEGLGEVGGQCTSGPGTTNDVIGSWYSLPTEGLCGEGEPVGTNGCSWQINGRMKTINGSCLLSPSFKNSCYAGFKDGNFTAAMQLFQDAFISDDPAENGCPPLPVNTPKSSLPSSSVVQKGSPSQQSSSKQIKALELVAALRSIAELF